MKTIGLIGGMSWESTAVYYRRLNQEVRRLSGGLHSAEIILRSIDFVRIVEIQKRGAWSEAAAVLRDIAVTLENSGADMILICTNTMHKVADEVQNAISVPLIHIADVTGQALNGRNCQRPLLLATQYTMEQDFYRHRLHSGFGIEALIPDAADRITVHDIIF
jgi:aspartate racemase